MLNRRLFFKTLLVAVLGKYCPQTWRPSIVELIQRRMEQAYMKMQAELARSLYCDGQANYALNGLQEAVEFVPRQYMGISRANYNL